MTHVVLGYPTLPLCEKLVDILASKSDFIELQIPFSDPIADGPTIAGANYQALTQKITLEKCLVFAKKVARKHSQAAFYFMSYYNPIFRYGSTRFIKAAKAAGIRGFIVPDLPLEEAGDFLQACRKEKLNFIFVLAPNTAPERLKNISKNATGFLYCVARLGVTGKKTKISTDLKKFINQVRKHTRLPLAVGFGIQNRQDLEKIKATGADIAVVGSAIIKSYEKNGLSGVQHLITGLKK
jgi:tryptophan synthase alpha chain